MRKTQQNKQTNKNPNEYKAMISLIIKEQHTVTGKTRRSTKFYMADESENSSQEDGS